MYRILKALFMEIFPHPEYEELKAEYHSKKALMLDLIIDRDQLKYVAIPNLNAVYMQQFGAILIERLEKEHTYLRLRRKIELIQARMNAGQKVNLTLIEETLESEFYKWEEEIEQLIKEKESADSWFDSCLPPPEAGELKLKYREIVKKLHPDLNPNLSSFETDLWHKTQEAYQHGNIEEIRRIFLILDDMACITGIPKTDIPKEIAAKIDQLDVQIAKINEEIRILKTKFPLNFRRVLDDSNMTNTEKSKIKENIDDYVKKIQFLEAQLLNLKLIIDYEQFN